MQPLINLKQFLAVLLILIVPAALLTAYFRNYQPETGGAGHQHADAAGTHPAGGHGDMAMPAGGGDAAKQPPAGGEMDHSKKTGAAGGGQAQKGGGGAKQPPAGGEMDHSKMTGAAGGQTQPTQPPAAAQQGAPPAPDAKQLEASRAQLEASRAQLEASRQALEATKTQPAPQEGKPPASGVKPAESAPPAESEKKPDAPKQGGAADGHTHKH